MFIWLVIICTVTLSAIGLIAWKTQRSPYRDGVLRRLHGDLRLVRRLAIPLAASSFVIGYLQSIVGRNLAFYRHHPLSDYVVDPEVNLKQHRLVDLGFDLIPDHAENESILSVNELLQYTMAGAVITTSLAPYVAMLWANGRVLKYQTINVVYRLLRGIAIGHLFRMMTFLATSIPGPSPHCIGPMEAENHPHDLWHVLWFPHTGSNCGDLIFSGHILFATTAICVAAHYTSLGFGPARGRAVIAVLIPVYALQWLFILASRAHYTVDMVSSAIISSLSWLVQTHIWFPEEPQPYDDAQSARSPPPPVEDSVEEGATTAVPMDALNRRTPIVQPFTAEKNRGSKVPLTVDESIVEKRSLVVAPDVPQPTGTGHVNPTFPTIGAAKTVPLPDFPRATPTGSPGGHPRAQQQQHHLSGSEHEVHPVISSPPAIPVDGGATSESPRRAWSVVVGELPVGTPAQPPANAFNRFNTSGASRSETPLGAPSLPTTPQVPGSGAMRRRTFDAPQANGAV